MSVKLQELIANADYIRGYKDWLEHPVTKKMLEVLKDIGTPVSLKTPSGEGALYQYGLIEGINLAITTLTRLEELGQAAEKAEKMTEQPDYGAGLILKERYGYDNR